VLRALEAGVSVTEVFFCEQLIRHVEARRAVQVARDHNVGLRQVTPEVFAKLAFGERIEGVVAVARTPTSDWPNWTLSSDSLLVALEHTEKPGNLGGVIRTADAAGVEAVLVADTGVDLYNPNVIRASLGTVFTTPIAAASGREILSWLRERKTAIYAACVDGAVDYAHVDFTGPAAIVLGSETRGLSRLWRARDVVTVSLPMLGHVDSLNVSVAAGVLMYEALRQRRG
jgi:TrmH family RNA methyltransferase